MLWVLVMLMSIGAQAVTPGIKAKITQKGLDYGRQVGMKILKSSLLNSTIPDFHGSYSVPVMGSINYVVKGIQIKNINLEKSFVAFVPKSRLKLTIGPSDAQIDGQWSVKLFFLYDSGTLKLSMRDVNVAVLVEVGWDGKNRLVVNPADCSCSIGHLDLTFQGGASWIYNLFKGYMVEPIRQALNNKLCVMVRDAIGAAQQTLQTIPESSHISPLADLDFSLVAAPAITEQSIEVDLKGEIYSQTGHRKPPGSPAPFLLREQNDHMLLLGVSDFVANSTAFVYYQSGELSRNFTQSQIPKTFPFYLNTSSFKDLVPELSERFPDTPMALKIFARQPPTVQTQPGTLQLLLPGAIQAFVLPNGTTSIPVILLNIDIKTSGQVFVSGKNIGASLKLSNVSLALAHSEVGPFPVDELEDLLRVSLNSVILPRINSELKEGFPMPLLPNTSLQNMNIDIQEGFLVITTDVQYGP